MMLTPSFKDRPENSRFDVEEQLVGGLLLGNGRKYQMMPAAEDFKHPVFRRVVQAVGSLLAKGLIPEDPMIVIAEGGWTDEERKKNSPISAMVRAMDAAISDNNLEYWRAKLYEIAREEQTAQVRNKSKERLTAGDDPAAVLHWAQTEEQRILGKYTDNSSLVDMETACIDLVNRSLEGLKPEGLLYTGVPQFDYLTGGLLPSEYVILAARPSCGKTSAALNMMVSLARQGIMSLFFSLEMSRQLVASTINAIVTQVSGRKMLREPHRITNLERRVLVEKADELCAISRMIRVYHQPGMKASEMASVMRQEVRRGVRIAWVDHVLLTNEEGENETIRISRFSKSWNRMAKENGIPCVALTQLSRDNIRDNREPRLTDLKQCGSLEEDADVIWFLHPEKGVITKPQEKMKILQAKGRTCGVGYSEAMFNGPSQTFFPMERTQQDTRYEPEQENEGGSLF